MHRRFVVLLASVLLLAASAHAEKFKGYLWDVQGRNLVVEGVSVELRPDAQIERKNQKDISAADLRIGWEVEVEGDRRGDRFVAKKLKVRNKKNDDVKVRGFIGTVSDVSIEVEGLEMFWPRMTERPVLEPGMRLEGKGIVLDDGSVQLTEVELGARGFNQDEAKFMNLVRQDVAKLKDALELYDDAELIAYVTGVGESLVPAWVDPNELDFDFTVIDDPSLNAFALPDGSVVMHTGLLAILENEAQLATVLGHEIAHATNRHGYRGYKNQNKMKWLQLGAIAGGIAVEAATDKGWAGALAGLGAGLTVSAMVNGHGRKLEDEADRIGLNYMVDAGYDPFQAPEVWRVFDRYTSDQNKVQNFFFSDHSTHAARISNLMREINAQYRGKIDGDSMKRNADAYNAIVESVRVQVAARNYHRGETQNAAKAFARELERNPNDPVALYYQGKILWNTGGINSAEQALRAFRRAAAADGNFADPYREIGLVYYQLDQHEAAANAFETYLKMRPNAQGADEIRAYLSRVGR